MPVLLIMMTASGLHSQSPDTASKVWIPRADALRKLAQADSSRVYRLILTEKQKDIDTLLSRVAGLTKAVDTLKSAASDRKSALDISDKEIAALKADKIVLAKEIRKQKRKRFFTTLGGIITTGIATYFYLSK